MNNFYSLGGGGEPKNDFSLMSCVLMVFFFSSLIPGEGGSRWNKIGCTSGWATNGNTAQDGRKQSRPSSNISRTRWFLEARPI